MDRSTFLGFVLIGILLMVWLWMNNPPPQKNQPGADTLLVKKGAEDTTHSGVSKPSQEPGTTSSVDTLGKYFNHLAAGEEKYLTIETDLYTAVLTSQGGGIHSWTLKKFLTWDKYPVNLINPGTQSDFNILFYSSDGKLINSKNLGFSSDLPNGKTITLSNQDSLKIEYTLPVVGESRIIKELVFTNGKYSFDAHFRFEKMENIISNFEYQVVWESGLKYAERNSVDESNSAMAYAYGGGEVTDVDATKFDESITQSPSGKFKWVAERTKYFGLAIICQDEAGSQGAYLDGIRLHKPDNGAEEYYSIGMKMQYLGKDTENSNFTVFFGPLDYNLVKSYNVDLEKIMNLGAAWVIRPIAEYIMLPLFQFIHLLIPNYGIVIIVFSIIIKIVLYPLTKTSMKSMQKMQKLQPMMEELKVKYKDDPQKMNQAVMRLYKEYGVNPAGGCLPMLLQLPILYALWAVFRTTIQLRQAAFFGWIHDLSIPDVIAKLPFPLPIMNITEISGLSLFMGITMFVQQKMSVKDPRQKMMVWMMPLMMTLIFNNFPAGLNLYYFVFNILQIGQQWYLNKTHQDEPLRKVEEKKKSGGILARMTKDMPKLKR
jgi:YidC/Oxa1 family membrane protein insertase